MKFRNVEFNDGHLRFQFVNSQEEEYDPAQEFYNEWYKLQTIQEEKERREKEQEKFLRECEEEINAEYKKITRELREKTIRELAASSDYSFKPDMNYLKTLENGFLLRDVKGEFYFFFNMKKNKISKFKIIKETVDAYIVKSSRTGKLGVLDKECKIIVPTKYRHIYETKNAYIVEENVYICETLKGVYNRQGKIILPIGNLDIKCTGDGYIVRANSIEKSGVIDLEGKFIIPMKCNQIKKAKDGYIVRIVRNENHLEGVYNKQGRKIIPPEYRYITEIKNADGYIVEDEEFFKGVGDEIIPPKESFIREIVDGYIVCDKHNSEGVYDKQGRVIIPPKYRSILEMDDGTIYCT